MPEAVIVDAIRTPIGRAGKGSLKTVRAEDLAGTPLRRADRAQSAGRAAGLNHRTGSMGAASSVGEAGLQHRPQRDAAGWDRPSCDPRAR